MSEQQQTRDVAPVPRLALSAEEAAEAIGIGRRKLWELTNRGEVPHRRLGNRIVYPVRELTDWLGRGCDGRV